MYTYVNPLCGLFLAACRCGFALILLVEYLSIVGRCDSDSHALRTVFGRVLWVRLVGYLRLWRRRCSVVRIRRIIVVVVLDTW